MQRERNRYNAFRMHASALADVPWRPESSLKLRPLAYGLVDLITTRSVSEGGSSMKRIHRVSRTLNLDFFIHRIGFR